MARAAPCGGSREEAVSSSVPAGNSTSLHAVIYVHACRQSCPRAAAAQTVRRSSSLAPYSFRVARRICLAAHVRLADAHVPSCHRLVLLAGRRLPESNRQRSKEHQGTVPSLERSTTRWACPRYCMDSQEAPPFWKSISWMLFSSPVTARTTFVASLKSA